MKKTGFIDFLIIKIKIYVIKYKEKYLLISLDIKRQIQYCNYSSSKDYKAYDLNKTYLYLLL